MLPRELEAAAIAACEEIVFFVLAAVPDGADGVEDPIGGKVEAGGSFCISGGAAVEFSAGGEEPGAGSAVDGAIDTAAAEQRGVCCVDDGVNLLSGYVSLQGNELGHVRIRLDDTPGWMDGCERRYFCARARTGEFECAVLNELT